jgi:hypothetical protein
MTPAQGLFGCIPKPIRPVARGLRRHLAGEILHLGKSGLIAAVLERAKEGHLGKIPVVVDQIGSNWRGDRPGPNWSSNDDEIIDDGLNLAVAICAGRRRSFLHLAFCAGPASCTKSVTARFITVVRQAGHDRNQ